MKPLFFDYGGIELSSYALMLSLGACLGFWLTSREVERKGLDPGALLILAALAFAAGVIGGRGTSFLLHRHLYEGKPWWTFMAVWDRGGMSSYGGLALAAVVGWVYTRLRGLELWDVADTLVVSWVPFLSLVRVGCFLNGCCYGRPTTLPWGLVAGGSANHVAFGIASHPAQLYAVAATTGIFALLWWTRTRRTFAGQLAVSFGVLYPAFRFFHESVRGDLRTTWTIAGTVTLSFNQIVSVIVVLLSLGLGFVLARRGPPATP